MTTAVNFINPREPIIWGGGVVAGGSLIFGQPNQTPNPSNPATLKNVYLEPTKANVAANPQNLDSNGIPEQPLWMEDDEAEGNTYSLIIRDRNGAQLTYIPFFNPSELYSGNTAVAQAVADNAAAALASQNEAAASATSAGNDATQTAADRVQTGQDRVQTGEDRVQTGQDRVQTGEDVTVAGNARDEAVEAAQGIAIRTYQTVAQLRASTGLVEGEKINLIGYSQPGIGGGDLYVSSDTTGTDNGGTRFENAAGQFIDRQLDGFVTPEMFGMLSSATDNSQALARLIQHDGVVQWSDNTYNLTSEVTETVNHNINWESSGSRIVNNSAAATHTTIEILSGPQNHSIIGDFTVDANDNSYIGLRFENTSNDKGSFNAEDLTCVNAHRSGTDFVGGAGFNIRGYYETVTLTRPTIKNCHLGAGAGISGIVGISGMLFEPKSTTPFQAIEICHIIDPNIEDVYSDDLAYVIDQDGINFRTAGDDPLVDLPWPTQLNIDGGVFKNCWGRSVKSQSESTYVDNVHLIRTEGNEHNGSDIDLQVGGGSVTRIRCTYEAFTPNWVVTASGSRRDGKLVAFTTVRDVKVSIAAGQSINAVVNCANREFTRQSWFISDLVVRGGSVDYAVRFTGGNNSTNLLSLTDVNVDTLNENLVWTGVNSFSDDAKVIIKRAFHAGTPVDMFRANSATSPLVSSEDVFGFNEDTRVDQVGSGSVGPFTRVDRIAPIDSVSSGFLKPVSMQLADDEVFSFPIIGFNTGSNLVIISASANRQSKGIFSYDTGAATKITSEGTSFSTGSTSEPGTGLFRLWVSGGTLMIANRSGTSRMFTCLMIG